MPLPPDKVCICPISFYRMPNAYNRSVNAMRREKRKQKRNQEVLTAQILALFMLILGIIIGKCFIVE